MVGWDACTWVTASLWLSGWLEALEKHQPPEHVGFREGTRRGSQSPSFSLIIKRMLAVTRSAAGFSRQQ